MGLLRVFWNVGLETHLGWVVLFVFSTTLPAYSSLWSGRARAVCSHCLVEDCGGCSLSHCAHQEAAPFSSGCRAVPSCLATSSHVLQSSLATVFFQHLLRAGKPHPSSWLDTEGLALVLLPNTGRGKGPSSLLFPRTEWPALVAVFGGARAVQCSVEQPVLSQAVSFTFPFLYATCEQGLKVANVMSALKGKNSGRLRSGVQYGEMLLCSLKPCFRNCDAPNLNCVLLNSKPEWRTSSLLVEGYSLYCSTNSPSGHCLGISDVQGIFESIM